MKIEPAAALVGDVGVPGVKSISHRALLLGALANGESEIHNFGRAGDTESTIRVVRQLGVEVFEDDDDHVRVRGVGMRGLRAPREPLNCGNAGTLLRLIAGILAGQAGEFVLTGDESLSSRPMERIGEPLRLMGADVETVEGHAPVTIRGGALKPIKYELPVASAQVKSCILLAGLYAGDGPTIVVEHGAPTRDHTERMLQMMGARVQSSPRQAMVWPAERLEPLSIELPGDFSSAAPLIVAATLLSGSELRIHGVNLNPTRTGLLDVLERMGARITIFNKRMLAGEPAGDLEVRSADLTATTVAPNEVPLLIDELPLFALAAARAHGNSEVKGAQELRTKESDRIESVTTSLKALGIRMDSRHDGFGVRGIATRPKGGGMHSSGDHRLAMLGAIAGLVSREGVEVGDAEAAAISFPGFFDLLESVAQR
ncbi:MAG: 3-phosphoshikimate 1-carboxyvinyltransferase [Gaiellaceae bacterium]